MTPERLAEIRKKVSVGVYYSDTLVRELLDHIAQLEAQRGVAVVEFADHRFSVNCDTAQKGGNQAIYVNNDTTGVGYQIAGTDIDGHFKRKTWDLTPYMRPFIETIGIRPIPADRVLADGMVGVDRKVLTDLREGLQNILDEIPNGEDQGEGYTDPVEIQCWKIREAKSALDALRAQQAKGE